MTVKSKEDKVEEVNHVADDTKRADDWNQHRIDNRFDHLTDSSIVVTGPGIHGHSACPLLSPRAACSIERMDSFKPTVSLSSRLIAPFMCLLSEAIIRRIENVVTIFNWQRMLSGRYVELYGVSVRPGRDDVETLSAYPQSEVN